MPAGCGEPSEQRFAACFLIEVKALGIELRGEALDRVGRERERPQFAPLADRHILEKTHQPATTSSRRRTMIGETITHSASPAALRTPHFKVTIPVSGRLRDLRASTTSTSSIKS